MSSWIAWSCAPSRLISTAIRTLTAWASGSITSPIERMASLRSLVSSSASRSTHAPRAEMLEQARPHGLVPGQLRLQGGHVQPRRLRLREDALYRLDGSTRRLQGFYLV